MESVRIPHRLVRRYTNPLRRLLQKLHESPGFATLGVCRLGLRAQPQPVLQILISNLFGLIPVQDRVGLLNQVLPRRAAWWEPPEPVSSPSAIHRTPQRPAVVSVTPNHQSGVILTQRHGRQAQPQQRPRLRASC